jgi:hypothetical protein
MKKKLPGQKRLTQIFYCLCMLLLSVNIGFGQQTIGEFPVMDGGLEAQTITTISVITPNATDWTISTSPASTTRTVVTDANAARSGNKYISFSNAASGNTRLQSPIANTLVGNTQYTVQYYFKAAASPLAYLTGAIYINGTGANAIIVPTPATFVANTWIKGTATFTSANQTLAPKFAGPRINGLTNTTDIINVDDFVVYAGAVDNTAPTAPTAPTVNGLAVSWTAPGTGVDGGGYVVVRYSSEPNADGTNDPNQNGIYKIGNTTTNGTGSLVGTVVYVGTSTSFTDAVAGSSSGNDYYKIYSVDKAFNYSAEITGKQSASAPAITAAPTTLSGFNYVQGSGPSATQSFVVGGTNLTTDLVVTPSTNYEISSDNVIFAFTPIALTPSSGTVSTTTIYTRLKVGLSNGTYNESIQLTSTAATTLTVACSGSVSGTYYYDGSGLLSDSTNWGTNTDGTGTNPVSLTSANGTFIITNAAAISTDAAWVLGVGSKIIIGDAASPAVALTVASTKGITGTIDIPAASSGSNSLVWQDATTFPIFGTLHNTSEVHLQMTNSTLGITATFGKLFLDGTANISVGSGAPNYIKATIQTSLTIATGAFINLSNGSNSYFYINTGGTVAVNGTLKTSKPQGIVGFGLATPVSDANTNTSPALQFFDAENPGINLVLTGSTVEFSRGGSPITQVVAPRSDYNNVVFSDFSSAGSKTLSGNITISGILTMNHAFGTTMIGTGSITLGNGASIVRTMGDFGTLPFNFGSSVNVTYNGTAAINSGNEIPGTTSVLNNLTIGNAGGVTLTSATAVNNKLSITAGTLTTGGFLTLKSNASKTAYVAPVTGSISGNTTTERYIPAGFRAYRLLSSPVTTTTSINANWQEGGVFISGYGTHITGTGTGFDATTSNQSSLFTHVNAAPAWTAANNTDVSTLTAGSPYLVYIRGSRLATNIDGSLTNDATTLRGMGALTIGTVAVNDLNANADGFSLIGNPYQAQVDMQAVLTASTNLNTNYYYVLNPKLGTKGQYVTVDVTTPANNTGDANKYLQPWQACFVKTTAAAGATLSFTEANKSDAVAQTSVFRIANTSSRLRLSLYDTATLAQNGYAVDGLLIAFDANESNDVNENDAVKLTNLDENMATSNSSKLLSIEKRAIPADSEEIPLNITKYKATSYTIKAEGSSLTGPSPYLLDKYTNTTTEIPQAGSVNYAYTVDTAIPSSTAADRFKIIYGKTLKTIDNVVSTFAIYPNPSKTNSFSLVVPQGMNKAEVTVSNILGQKLYSQTGLQSGTTVKISPSNVLTSGVYLVSLGSEGTTTTTKWIVE